MRHVRGSAAAFVCILLGLAEVSAAQSRPIFTTHFFDWYQVSSQRPYSDYQRQWTYHPEWERYNIQPSEIGVTENYYAVQMRMIHQAGFDGIHYEWFGAQPSDAFITAIQATRMKVAMFYDQEIRFHPAANFIKPTDQFAQKLINDIGSFYDRIPRSLWLHQADGALPIIFYGYEFDQSYGHVSVWDHFYRTLLNGIRKRLDSPVHIYWTATGALQQIYAFQRFPQISSYTFGWWGGQPQLSARSVTLIASYDDAGAGVGGRPVRTVNDDLRYLEDDFQLAEFSSSELVFNYGWNEFYEGEHIFPDTTWSDWRLRALSAIVKRLKTQVHPRSLPSTLILADDLFPDSVHHPNRWYNSELNLLNAYRYLFPQANLALGETATSLELKHYRIVIAMDRDRAPAEENLLIHAARTGHTQVVVFEPDAERSSPLAAQFAAGSREQPLRSSPPPPSDQWVGVSQPVNVDTNRYPFIHIQVRNSLNTFYMVRFQGVDAQGNAYENHDGGSPLDWQTTGDRWTERTENAKEILEAFAHKPIPRITGIVLILNGSGTPGDFHASFAHAAFTDASGHVGAQVNFDSPSHWKYLASFQNGPGPAWPRGGFTTMQKNAGVLKLSLQPRYAETPVDSYSQTFRAQPGVHTLAWAAWNKERVPLVLQLGHLFWVNSASSTIDVYRPLMAKLGMPAPITPRFTTFTEEKGIVAAGSATGAVSSVILHPAELPMEWVRMVHPPNFPIPVSYPYPVTSRPLAEVMVRNGIPQAVPLTNWRTKDGSMQVPGKVTLHSGEVVDFYRLPISIAPISRRSSSKLTIEATRYTSSSVEIMLRGRGNVVIRLLRPGLRLLWNGRRSPARLKLPCYVKLAGKLEWDSTPWSKSGSH